MRKKIRLLWLRLKIIKASKCARLFYKHHHKLVFLITLTSGCLLLSIVAFLTIKKPTTIVPKTIIALVKEKKIEKSINYTDFDIMLPSIDVFAPVIIDVDGYDQGAYNEALKKGVAHFKDTAKPDDDGNVFIFGHSTNWQWVEGDYKTIFQKLPDLKKDDDIILQYKKKKYYYKVVFSQVTAYDDMNWINQDKKDVVTLMTCYPIGSNKQRIVIRGELYKVVNI